LGNDERKDFRLRIAQLSHAGQPGGSGIPSFDEHPFNVPAIYNFRDMAFDQPVTFLVGENGSGKSTLLEAIAIAWGFNPEAAAAICGLPPATPIPPCTSICG
jgi:AAA15 family ATPase/GTPase